MSNQILEPNQYASLAVDESNENKDMEHNVTPGSTHTENSTKSGRRIQHQKEKQRHSVEPNKQTSTSISYSENTNEKESLIPKIRGFKMASLNIASLLKHIDELRVVMHNNDIDVLAINETRMDSTIPIELISLSGYTWVSKRQK